MKTGILFAGQGAQYTGMGKSLFDGSEAARSIFQAAGEEVQDWCFNGTKEMLRMTQITQPCIYTVTMAAYGALQEALKEEGSPEMDDMFGEIEKLLDSIFKATALDVSSDITVLNTLLAQEGLTDDELTRLRKKQEANKTDTDEE